jgi:hypothetical protein
MLHAARPILLTVALLAAPLAAFAQPLCSWEPPAPTTFQAPVEIDKVWTGARVDFAAARNQTQYVIGYYDRERWLTIARVNANSRDVQRDRLPDRFDGWDSHNSVALAFDADGLLHVAANMHASKLNYFRAPAPDKAPVRATMTGRDDAFVTYPQFLKSADGPLLFIYRSGRSGDGAWKVNRWDGRAWATVTQEPFLASRGFGRNVSAYPSRFMVSPDGYIHLAIVWRLTTDAATNVEISYAKTRDFVSWFDHSGRRLKLPLSPETTERVLHTGQNAGLLNNAKVSVDARGRPVIVFTRFDKQNRNTVELLIGENGGWRNVLVATAERSSPVSGTGSLPNTVALAEVDFSQPERPILYYRFPGQSGVRVALDPATLNPACTEKPAPDGLGPFFDRPIPTMRPQILPVGPQARLVWTAQPANNDRQPACTAAAPLACKPPPSTLKLLIDRQAGAP